MNRRYRHDDPLPPVHGSDSAAALPGSVTLQRRNRCVDRCTLMTRVVTVVVLAASIGFWLGQSSLQTLHKRTSERLRSGFLQRENETRLNASAQISALRSALDRHAAAIEDRTARHSAALDSLRQRHEALTASFETGKAQYVSLAVDYSGLHAQLVAANATARGAESARTQREEQYVALAAEHAELQAQLAAASATARGLEGATKLREEALRTCTAKVDLLGSHTKALLAQLSAAVAKRPPRGAAPTAPTGAASVLTTPNKGHTNNNKHGCLAEENQHHWVTELGPSSAHPLLPDRFPLFTLMNERARIEVSGVYPEIAKGDLSSCRNFDFVFHRRNRRGEKCGRCRVVTLADNFPSVQTGSIALSYPTVASNATRYSLDKTSPFQLDAPVHEPPKGDPIDSLAMDLVRARRSKFGIVAARRPVRVRDFDHPPNGAFAKKRKTLPRMLRDHPSVRDAVKRILAKQESHDQAQHHKSALVMCTNGAHVAMVLNFFCSLRAHSIGVPRHIVFVTHARVAKQLNAAGIHAYQHDSFNPNGQAFANLTGADSPSYGDGAWSEMMLLKTYAAHATLEAGYDVLFQDADITWNESPWAELQHNAAAGYDTQWMEDGSRQARFSPFAANSGFFYLKYNSVTRWFWDNVVQELHVLDAIRSQQELTTFLLESHHSRLGLTVLMLPHAKFTSGAFLNQQNKHGRVEFVTGSNSTVLHFCWTNSKIEKVALMMVTGGAYLPVKHIVGGVPDEYWFKHPWQKTCLDTALLANAHNDDFNVALEAARDAEAEIAEAASSPPPAPPAEEEKEEKRKRKGMTPQDAAMPMLRATEAANGAGSNHLRLPVQPLVAQRMNKTGLTQHAAPRESVAPRQGGSPGVADAAPAPPLVPVQPRVVQSVKKTGLTQHAAPRESVASHRGGNLAPSS